MSIKVSALVPLNPHKTGQGEFGTIATFPSKSLQENTPLEKAFTDITKEMVSELLKRNAHLPPTEVVRITTMSGCSAVKK